MSNSKFGKLIPVVIIFVIILACVLIATSVSNDDKDIYINYDGEITDSSGNSFNIDVTNDIVEYNADLTVDINKINEYIYRITNLSAYDLSGLEYIPLTRELFDKLYEDNGLFVEDIIYIHHEKYCGVSEDGLSFVYIFDCNSIDYEITGTITNNKISALDYRILK